MTLPAAYPTSSIQTRVLQTISNNQRSAASSAGSADSVVTSPAAAAAVVPQGVTQAVLYMSSFLASDVLPPEIEFLLLASAPRMSLKVPFGAGLTVQRSNVDGDILDPVGE
jgi:hypothetical protein